MIKPRQYSIHKFQYSPLNLLNFKNGLVHILFLEPDHYFTNLLEGGGDNETKNLSLPADSLDRGGTAGNVKTGLVPYWWQRLKHLWFQQCERESTPSPLSYMYRH